MNSIKGALMSNQPVWKFMKWEVYVTVTVAVAVILLTVRINRTIVKQMTLHIKIKLSRIRLLSFSAFGFKQHSGQVPLYYVLSKSVL